MRVADAGIPQSEPRPATIREAFPANHNLDRRCRPLLAGCAVGLLGHGGIKIKFEAPALRGSNRGPVGRGLVRLVWPTPRRYQRRPRREFRLQPPPHGTRETRFLEVAKLWRPTVTYMNNVKSLRFVASHLVASKSMVSLFDCNEPHEAPAHCPRLLPRGPGSNVNLDPAMPSSPRHTRKKRPAPPVKVMIGRKALTDGRGPGSLCGIPASATS